MTKDNEPLDLKPEVPELQEKLPEASELVKQVAEWQKKAQENWDKALRATAERENAEKRALREVEQAHKFALEGFIKSLLPIVDNLERGLEASSKDPVAQTLHQGIELTHKLFMDTLKKYHVEAIDPLNQTFDPTHHEALTTQPSDTVPEHQVMSVVQKGYMLHGRLIRPAQVVVSKGKA